MNRRSQDDLDHLPSISLAPDELSDRKVSSGRGDKKGKAAPGRAVQEKKGKGFPVVVWLLALALLALAAGGYLQIRALQDELVQSRDQLSATVARLNDVSGTVSETGATLNRSDSEVRDELKTVNHEIRKLWDLSNKRNRRNIEAQGSRLGSVEKTIKSLGSDLKTLNGRQGENLKELNQLQTEMRSISAEIVAGTATSKEQMELLLQKVTVMEKKLTATISEVKVQRSATEGRLKEFADKTRALDAYRQQVNRRLLQIESSIRALGSAAPRASAAPVKPAAGDTTAGA